MPKIWDAHNHWMPPEIAEQTSFFKRGWTDIDALLKTLDKLHVEKAVLLYPNSDAHLKLGWVKLCALYNEALANKVKEHPTRLIGAGILPVDNPKEMFRELHRIKQMGLSALSLASSYEGKYLDDPSFLPVLEMAEKEKLPVFVHSQIINPIGYERVQDPLLMPVIEYIFDMTMSVGKLMMSGALARLKNLKIVFGHFAGVLPFIADRFDSTYAMLRSRNMVPDIGNVPTDILKNVFVDTSGTTSPAILEMAIGFFGPARVLWGSDFPAKKDLKESITVLEHSAGTIEDRENMLAGNLMNIFNPQG
ncbi:MAG: amidohydrolase family protein [Candidatus Omnitrophota bacterium]